MAALHPLQPCGCHDTDAARWPRQRLRPRTPAGAAADQTHSPCRLALRSPPPASAVDPQRPRLQQTRFERRVAAAAQRLQRWAKNPWRRLSLLAIVLLSSFAVGSGLGAITGALARIDQISALICVLLLEMAVRLRRPLLQRPGDRLGLQLLDMVRLGLLYGLIMDAFKLL